MKRASKVERNSLDKQQGERAREEDLRERIVVESRIRSNYKAESQLHLCNNINIQH
jgi:hypothetical protein